MKKILKLFLGLILAFYILPINTYAQEIQPSRADISTKIRPTWWPGNPNPQPGTEDWFFQHPDYGSGAPSELAQSCGYSAILGSLVPSLGAAAYETWVAKKRFDLSTFMVSFTLSMTLSYATCLWSGGVR